MKRIKKFLKVILIKLHVIKPFLSTYYRDMCNFQMCLEDLERSDMSFNDYLKNMFK